MKIVKDGRLVELDRQLTQAEYDQAILDTANADINPAAMSVFHDGLRLSDATKQQVGLLAQAAVAKAAKHAEEMATIDRANRIAAADAGNIAQRPAPTSGSEYQQRALALRDLVTQVYGDDRQLRVLPDQNGYPFPALAICHSFSGHPEYAGSVDVLERRVELDRRELDIRRRQQQAVEEYAAQKARELHDAQLAAYENPVTAQLRAELQALRAQVSGHQPTPATSEQVPAPGVALHDQLAAAEAQTPEDHSLIGTLKSQQAAVLDRFRSRG